MDRLSMQSVTTQNIKALTRMKRVKVSAALVVLLIMYSILFSTTTSDTAFLVVGGALGCFSALLIVVDGLHQRQVYGSNLAMLFWRSTCDLGLALRFILTPAFNYYVCGEITCDRNTSDGNLCGFPGAVLQFFMVASEMWFLCNGIDLFYSITNPFSSFKSRIKYYHAAIWSLATIVCLVPFTLGPDHRVYGFWFVNHNISDSNICWLKTGDNKLGFSVWAMFLVPLALIDLSCLASLFIAYVRVRKGLNRTFLPKMKLLVANTINVVVLALFWGIFIFLYALTFMTRDEDHPNYHLNSLLYFTLASKGFSSFFVWIFVNDYNLTNFSAQQDETADANVALREEVLTFATAGIRSSARGAAGASADRAEIVRRPEHSRMEDTNLIGMYFYFKFLMGYSEEIRSVEKMISDKRKSMSESVGRPTHSVDVRLTDVRLSQRPTVLAGEANKSEVKVQERATETGGEASVVDMVEVMSNTARQFAQKKRGSGIIHMSEAEAPKSSSIARPGSSTVTAEIKLSIFSNLHKSLSNFFSGETWDSVEFTEYQPYHFRRIRLAVGISDEYFASAFSTTIKERLTEGGASGAFFFFSKGENFIAKSCTEEEVNVLRNNALLYADFIIANPDSYISKILGVYTLRIYGNSLNFFVMNNLFYNEVGLSMNEKYDIKGSWVARNAKPPVEGKSFTCSYCEQKFIYKKTRKLNRLMVRSKTSALSTTRINFEVSNSGQGKEVDTFSPLGEVQMEEGGQMYEETDSHCPYTVNGNHEPNIILKDNDLKFKIRLPLETAVDVLKQLRKDAEFLASLGIMDYSLLLGVHNTEYEVQTRAQPSRVRLNSADSLHSIGGRMSILRKQGSSAIPFSESDDSKQDAEYLSSMGDSQNDGSMLDTDSSPPASIVDRSKLSRKLSNVRVTIVEPESSASSKSFENSFERAESVTGAGLALTKMLEVSKVVGPDTYFMGIIDFQQKWNWTKKWERFFKVNINGADPVGLSAVEPEQYKERFLRKLEDIIDFDTTSTRVVPFK